MTHLLDGRSLDVELATLICSAFALPQAMPAGIPSAIRQFATVM